MEKKECERECKQYSVNAVRVLSGVVSVIRLLFSLSLDLRGGRNCEINRMKKVCCAFAWCVLCVCVCEEKARNMQARKQRKTDKQILISETKQVEPGQ